MVDTGAGGLFGGGARKRQVCMISVLERAAGKAAWTSRLLDSPQVFAKCDALLLHKCGGRPPIGVEGGGGASTPPWATAAAVGPGGRAADRLGWGHIGIPAKTIQSPKTFYKASEDHTKRKNIIHSPDRVYEDIKSLYKDITYLTEPHKL